MPPPLDRRQDRAGAGARIGAERRFDLLRERLRPIDVAEAEVGEEELHGGAHRGGARGRRKEHPRRDGSAISAAASVSHVRAVHALELLILGVAESHPRVRSRLGTLGDRNGLVLPLAPPRAPGVELPANLENRAV